MKGRLVVFTVEDRADADLAQLRANDCISRPLQEFLATMTRLAADHPNREVRRPQLVAALKERGLAHSAGAISRHLNTLKTRKVAAPPRLRTTAGETVQYIEITQLLRLDTGEDRPRRARWKKTDIQRQMELWSEEGALLEASDQQLPITQSLMSILDAAMLSSQRDLTGDRKEVISVYRVNRNERVKIRTYTASKQGAEIAQLSDLRVVRALNAMLLDKLREFLGEESQQRNFRSIAEAMELAETYAARHFFFDLYDVCRRIGLNPWPSNLEIVRAIIHRLKDTTFAVDATDSPTFQKRYLPASNSSLKAHVGEYRFITEFYAASEEEVRKDGLVQHTERFYWVRFNALLVANLLLERLVFIGHPELFSEASGMAQRLANWLKAWIGVNKRSDRSNALHQYTIDELHELVLPHVRPDNFARDFLNLLQRQVENGSGPAPENDVWDEQPGSRVRAWLYGYFVELLWDEDEVKRHCRKRGRRVKGWKRYPLVSIWRDRDDEYVGDNSTFNRLQDARMEPQGVGNTAELQSVNEWAMGKNPMPLIDTDEIRGDIDGLEWLEWVHEAWGEFREHHAKEGTMATEAGHDKNWIGWCKRRRRAGVGRKRGQRGDEAGVRQTTRARSIFDDLNDVSWAGDDD